MFWGKRNGPKHPAMGGGAAKSRAAGVLGTSLAALLVLQGCSVFKVGPDYEAPETLMPDAWHQKTAQGLAEGKADIKNWWTVFNDPILTDLVEQATLGNKDLQVAFGRIQEARAARGFATGEFYPDVDGAGSAERTRQSEGIVRNPGAPQKRVDNFYDIGLDATWEIDVFGRIGRTVESADASLQATLEDYRDVLVSLYAEVALNYMDVRAFQARIQFSKDNIATQAGTVKLTQDRLAAEIAPELDVRQAELNLSRTEAELPRLEQSKVQAINRLGVLLGQPPSSLHPILEVDAPIPRPPERVAVGLPSELLRQRPDIRSAERQVAAQTAQIGVATADLYPRFSLSGSFAFETAGSAIFGDGNHAWSFGPAFRWNSFDGGRIRNNILAQDARTNQLLSDYENTVLLALEDVENSMVAFEQEKIRRDALERSVIAAQESVRLVKELYIARLTDFQNVLDMERSLAEQQDDLAESAGRVSQNLVALYRSLGGGWEPDPPQLEEEIVDQEKNGEPIF